VYNRRIRDFRFDYWFLVIVVFWQIKLVLVKAPERKIPEICREMIVASDFYLLSLSLAGKA
jgi:hypothetical protein